MKRFFAGLIVIFVFSFSLFPSNHKKNKAKYVKKKMDPVLEEMFKANKEKMKKENELTQKIIKEVRKKNKKEKLRLRPDLSGIIKPKSPESFKYKVWHFSPVAQYLTGTCWSFSTTSFLESEVFRITGKKIKLSEMHTVYYEYVEKARGFVRTRGEMYFDQGSESNAVTRIAKKYGLVPYSIYKGIVEGEKYDHTMLFKEYKEYLMFVKKNGFWDEDEVIKHVKVILNKYMGEPPKKFLWDGKEYTPISFMKEVLKINPDDYIEFMSTIKYPFWEKGEFEAPDNWWHSKEYHNVPLDVFYSTIIKAIKMGYSVSIGGDVSEPGYYGEEDIAFIPTFDIPQNYIDQYSREMRMYNKTTTDDHGVHLVGYTRVKGKDWFLIKDSARSSRHGKFKGYMFYKGDYIKLKMLTFTVHKDVVKDILKRF